MTRWPSLSVIVSTYEWPAALDAVLHALADQGDSSFEIVVADDGSGPETAVVVDRWSDRLGGRLGHVWHEDRGFRKARVQNLAAIRSVGQYLLFLDGDCIPRASFVAAIKRSMVSGVFLAGKRLDLSHVAAQRVLAGNEPLWRRSGTRLALARAVPPRNIGTLLGGRDRRRAWRPDGPEFSAPYDSYGILLGVYRSDFEAVNGFDTRFVGWGEEDVDIAVRLRHLGLKCGWPGPRSTLLHLPHPKRKGGPRPNKVLLAETRGAGRIAACEGLRELDDELVGR